MRARTLSVAQEAVLHSAHANRRNKLRLIVPIYARNPTPSQQKAQSPGNLQYISVNKLNVGKRGPTMETRSLENGRTK